MSVTIFHNGQCGTSRKVLDALEARGAKPVVVEYLKAGWTKDQLKALFKQIGKTPGQMLRVKNSPAEELGLTAPGVRSDRILNAMVKHPILVERPIVVTDKGAALCRPPELLESLL